MIKSSSLLALLVASIFSSASYAADSYSVDPAHTYTHFSVSHLGFSTMQGRFDQSSGKITLDRAARNGSVEITIEAASLNTGYAKRDDHLKSPDFFNVAEHPKIIFKSNSIKFKGDNPATVEGNLTLLGVSKPVTLAITAIKCGSNPMNKKELCGAAASAQIKRSDFGMKYGLPNIGDEIGLVFEIEAYKD